MIENAVVVGKHANGRVTTAAMQTFINSTASTQEEFGSPVFQASEHDQTLKTGYLAQKTAVEEFDYALAFEYFSSELPRMAYKTRTSLLSTVMNTLHRFNTGMNRVLFAGESTITPKVMDDGKWIFVNMPVGRCGEEGAFALGVWKFMAEWHVLRRDSRKPNNLCVIHADEFHNIINKFDTRYLGECRKFGGCMIACTQSKASFYANMAGDAAEAQVDALLNNFNYKIIHALGDIKTAEWASQLVGWGLQYTRGLLRATAGIRAR